MKIRTAAVLLAASAALLGACSTSREGTSTRAPLAQPAPEQFSPGVCRDAADPILALGRFTYDHDGDRKLEKADYAELTANGEKLLAVRDKAQPAVTERISAVLTSIGYIRVRPGATYDPQLLRDLETARKALQDSCVT